MTWRPFDPSLDAVKRANRCTWHDDCADADRWAKVLGKPEPVHDPDDDAGTVTLHEGDSSWHDGPGWYYTIDDYPDEGSCGAFASRTLAAQHARLSGHLVDDGEGVE